MRSFSISVATLIFAVSATAEDLGKGLTLYSENQTQLAIVEIQPLADGGSAKAQYHLGRIYAEGRGVTPSQAEATRWFLKAAEQEFPAAQYELVLRFDQGLGVEKDPKLSAQWMLRAAENEYPDAQFAIGMTYYTISAIPNHYQKAAMWFRRAANQNHSRAQGLLATLYFHGSGVRQSKVDAYKWFSLAARHGDHHAARARDAIAESLTDHELKMARGYVQNWSVH